MACAQDRNAQFVDMRPVFTKEGQRAKIVGIASKPELNGRVVKIGPLDIQSSRYTVTVLIDNAKLKLKEENLETIADSDPFCLGCGQKTATRCSG